MEDKHLDGKSIGSGDEVPAPGTPLAIIEHDGRGYEILLPNADRDQIQKSLLNTGVPYEFAMLQDMRGRLAPGDLVLDVGANVGNHTLFLAAIAQARVIAFEPNRPLAEAIRASAARNGLDAQVDVRAIGLGRAAARAAFAAAMPENLGGQALTLGQGEIEILALDSLEISAPVRILKVDVEGMEIDVLRGAEALVRRDRPLLYIESRNEAAFRSISQWLQEQNYTYWETFNATPTHLFMPGERVSLDQRIEHLRGREVIQEYRLLSQLRRSRKNQENADARAAAADKRADLLRAEVEHLQAQVKDAQAAQAEIAALKRALAESKREQANVKAAAKDLEMQQAALRRSVTYQIGYRLKVAATSPREIVRLPASLGRLYADGLRNRRARAQREAKAPEPTHELPRARAPGPAPEFIAPRPLPQTAPQRAAEGARAPGEPPRLRVAAIFDDFTAASFRPEADFLVLTPQNWEAELETYRPDLVFIESAWHGRDGQWTTKISNNGAELHGILRWAAAAGVPTAFWNKEDPVHFQTFLNTARGFDHVFTTDIDCIHRYKAALGHDQVHFLPFACQPALHNPLEIYERKNAMSFAGSYYVRYPERIRDLETFVRFLPNLCPIEIFDRNFGKDDPSYQFPPDYRPYIVGTLPSEKIDIAYKGYRYAINLNSIKQSQTMFARRVYELLACNTLTVSNYSRGLRLMFGDLVPSSDDGPAMLARLRALAAEPDGEARLRLMALRKVMLEHTYRDRLDFIRSRVLPDAPPPRRLPHVVALADGRDAAAAGRIAAGFLAQSHADSRLVLVVDDPAWGPEHPRIEKRARDSLGDLCLEDLAGPGDWLACLSGSDHYGPHYLTDLILATRYSPATLIGKAAHFGWGAAGPVMADPDRAYLPMPSCPARRAILRRDCLPRARRVDATLADLDDLRWERLEGLAVDPWHYAAGAAHADPALLRALLEDLPDVNPGLPLAALQAAATAIDARTLALEVGPATAGFGADRLGELFGGRVGRQVMLRVEANVLVFESSLAEGAHEYVYAKRNIPVREFQPAGSGSDTIKCHLEMEAGFMAMNLVLRFLDRNKERISHIMMPGNFNGAARLPPGTEFVQLGLRLVSGGTARVRRLHLGHLHLPPAVILGRAEHLLIDTFYPAYDDLYRHGFVHTRVKAYRARNVPVDVFCLRPGRPLEGREFEGVDVLTGDGAALERMLATGRYRSILVHFLNPRIWDVLAPDLDRVPVTVWVHGSEIQPWWRRQYDARTDAELTDAKRRSDLRLDFWRGVLDPMHPNLKLVFVSRHFADEVMEDLGIALPRGQYEIIHNPIDTDLFSYVEKPARQRKKILSIRSYESAKYANDLSVKAIEALSREPFFRELSFHLIGDGVLFDDLVQPLRQFPNVVVERRFLTQPEIADLQKKYGIFLTPTRWDSQGVSRDEAMASGLVPVTNAVAAVLEFVDESCGILAPPEDAAALAEGIRALYHDSERFLSMSRAASERVRRQSAADLLIGREITAFGGVAASRLPAGKPLQAQLKRPRLLIFGSCVSRDALRFAPEDSIELLAYFARSSMASAFAPKQIEGVSLTAVESPFQGRTVSADLDKTLARTLEHLEPDIILHDPIDERFSLLALGDGQLLTRSSEFARAAQMLDGQRPREILSGSTEFLKLWEAGWETFLSLLDRRTLRDRLLINRVFWATRTETGESFDPPYTPEKIAEANAFLARIYRKMEADLPPEQFIRFPEEAFVGASAHKWGPAPFHYTGVCYKCMLDALHALTGEAGHLEQGLLTPVDRTSERC